MIATVPASTIPSDPMQQDNLILTTAHAQAKGHTRVVSSASHRYNTRVIIVLRNRSNADHPWRHANARHGGSAAGGASGTMENPSG